MCIDVHLGIVAYISLKLTIDPYVLRFLTPTEYVSCAFKLYYLIVSVILTVLISAIDGND